MKFLLKDIRLPVRKCKPPKFKDYGGRTWDSGKIKLNGSDTEVFLDTSWGQYIYFKFACQWLKVKMCSNALIEKEYNIDPFNPTTCDITVIQ